MEACFCHEINNTSNYDFSSCISDFFLKILSQHLPILNCKKKVVRNSELGQWGKKINIYIYIYSGVTISALTQAINFFQFNALKLFNAVNAGAEPRVGHPTHNCCFCLFLFLH